MMTPFRDRQVFARRDLRVAPTCEVGWFCPGTRAGDGLPYRGQTRMSADTPLAAWDRFEADHAVERAAGAEYVAVYAAIASEVPHGMLDRLVKRELELARAHNFWLAK